MPLFCSVLFLCCIILTLPPPIFFFFFFNDTATTEIYTLSLHDALPISDDDFARQVARLLQHVVDSGPVHRSEEHTSELQSLAYLVCRLLLEKKNNYTT